MATTFKLRAWNELYEQTNKRFFSGDADGKGFRVVEIAPDLRIACRCGLTWEKRS